MNRRKFFAGLAGMAAGIATGRWPRPDGWTNYTARYRNVNKAELIAKMRAAREQTLFMPPCSPWSRWVIRYHKTPATIPPSSETLLVHTPDGLVRLHHGDSVSVQC